MARFGYQPHYAKSLALVVGIDKYKLDVVPQLTTARFGAEALAAVLRDRYKFDDVVTLFDEEASKRDIEDAYTDLRARTGPDDRFVIYFAGHGAGLQGRMRVEGWLLAYDSDHTRQHRMVRMVDLVDPNYTTAKHALVILDSCHSGLAVTYETARSPRTPTDSRRALQQFLTRRAYQVIASSNPFETATDAGLLDGHTPFTGYLLRALEEQDRRARDRVTGLLTSASVADYVRSSVVSFARNWQGPQTGILPGDGGGVLVWALPTALDALPERLRRALTDSNPDTRYYALSEAEHLQADPEIGSAVREVLEDLIINDADQDVRRRALQAVQAGPDPTLHPDLPGSASALPLVPPAPPVTPTYPLITPENAKQVETLAVLEGHTSSVYGVAFSPDGLLLATASWDGTTPLWEVATSQVLTVLEGHAGDVWGTAFSPDGHLLATVSSDDTAQLWEVATGQAIAILEGHNGWVLSVAFSPDGHLLATTSEDHTVRLWDVETGQVMAVLEGHNGWVNSVAFSPDGRFLATASDDWTARLWEVETSQNLATLLGRHHDWAYSVTFSPDGQLLAVGSRNTGVQLWDFEADTTSTLKGHSAGVYGTSFSPDGRILATASRDKTVRLWEVETGKTLAVLEGHADWLRDLAFDPDGRLLATASDDMTARLWGIAG